MIQEHHAVIDDVLIEDGVHRAIRGYGGGKVKFLRAHGIGIPAAEGVALLFGRGGGSKVGAVRRAHRIVHRAVRIEDDRQGIGGVGAKDLKILGGHGRRVCPPGEAVANPGIGCGKRKRRTVYDLLLGILGIVHVQGQHVALCRIGTRHGQIGGGHGGGDGRREGEAIAVPLLILGGGKGGTVRYVFIPYGHPVYHKAEAVGKHGVCTLHRHVTGGHGGRDLTEAEAMPLTGGDCGCRDRRAVQNGCGRDHLFPDLEGEGVGVGTLCTLHHGIGGGHGRGGILEAVGVSLGGGRRGQCRAVGDPHAGKHLAVYLIGQGVAVDALGTDDLHVMGGHGRGGRGGKDVGIPLGGGGTDIVQNDRLAIGKRKRFDRGAVHKEGHGIGLSGSCAPYHGIGGGHGGRNIREGVDVFRRVGRGGNRCAEGHGGTRKDLIPDHKGQKVAFRRLATADNGIGGRHGRREVHKGVGVLGRVGRGGNRRAEGHGGGGNDLIPDLKGEGVAFRRFATGNDGVGGGHGGRDVRKGVDILSRIGRRRDHRAVGYAPAKDRLLPNLEGQKIAFCRLATGNDGIGGGHGRRDVGKGVGIFGRVGRGGNRRAEGYGGGGDDLIPDLEGEGVAFRRLATGNDGIGGGHGGRDIREGVGILGRVGGRRDRRAEGYGGGGNDLLPDLEGEGIAFRRFATGNDGVGGGHGRRNVGKGVGVLGRVGGRRDGRAVGHGGGGNDLIPDLEGQKVALQRIVSVHRYGGGRHHGRGTRLPGKAVALPLRNGRVRNGRPLLKRKACDRLAIHKEGDGIQNGLGHGRGGDGRLGRVGDGRLGRCCHGGRGRGGHVGRGGCRHGRIGRGSDSRRGGAEAEIAGNQQGHPKQEAQHQKQAETDRTCFHHFSPLQNLTRPLPR